MRKCAKCGNYYPENTDYVKYWHVKLTQVSCVVSKVCIYCTNESPKITKTCSKCGVVYPATLQYFNKRKTGKYGLSGQCKSCQAAKRLEKYQEN